AHPWADRSPRAASTFAGRRMESLTRRRNSSPTALTAGIRGIAACVRVRARRPMTPKAFHVLFARVGRRAGMPFPVHPHMLRHGCGYALANAGHDTRALQAWLGHKNIQHTARYTELSPDRFKNFWRD